MKKIIFGVLVFLPFWVMAQFRAKTQPMAFDMDASAMPSNINYVAQSLQFEDANGDYTIGANEQCVIRFQVTNTDDGDGHGCEARIKCSGTSDGITCLPVTLPRINKGDTVMVEFPIVTNHYTKDGTAHFVLEIYEPNGLGTGELTMDISTHQFVAPRVELGDYIVQSDKENLQRKEKFTLQVPLQNLAQGIAENVNVTIKCPSGVTLLSNNTSLDIPHLKAGEGEIISYEMIATVNAPDLLDFDIEVDEKYGKYAKGKHIQLRLGEKTTIASTVQSTREGDVEIQLISLVSDVDRDIPQTDQKNKNTFVVIIANENYQQVAAVPFALNDGKIFRQYCEQTLGISPKHIREYPNATGNQIKYSVNLLREKVEEYDNPNIIFYYAGHGIPDEQSKTAYLLPVDGILNDLSTCYKLDDLYSALGDLPAGQISVFMDACFSGSKREQGMLAAARGVALKAKAGQPKGNMVVFSAAQGDETAYPYSSKQHGMFTYYLLKKLQETKGDVTLQQLGDYIIKEVRRQSIEENDKKQTPCVTPASAVADIWQNWKLK